MIFMEKMKKLCKKLFAVHIAIVFIFVIAATIGLIYAFAYKKANPVIAYFSYFISAYALVLVCVKTPKMYKYIKKLRDENKYISIYRNQAGIRVKISLYGTFSINVMYATLQMILGIINHSVWFYALFGYYLLLAVMRLFLLREIKKDEYSIEKEIKLYRMCGILLLVMNQVLAVVATYIVRENRGFQYHYIVTIAMAAYTFTSFTIAIINMVRYRKYKRPLMSASKILSLVSSIVSMLSLETAMITAFGTENDGSFRQIITAVSGAAVCIIILVLAVCMIRNSTKEEKWT